MQTHFPLHSITPTEFNELLDEEFDNDFEIRRSPFNRKNRITPHTIRCDGLTWDEQFELTEFA